MKKISILFIGIFLILSGCISSNISNDNTTGYESAKEDFEIAQDTLITFFENLSKNEFDKAVNLFSSYDSDWENLKVYNEPDETDRVIIIKNYCNATTTCMKAEVLNIRKVKDDEYSMVVRFFKKNGDIYVLGPCCGATEEEMPSQEKFDFTVKKIEGEFRVTTPPIYVP